MDQEVELDGLGPLRYDLAFGGAFYAYVRADDAGVRCEPEEFRNLIERGITIKRAVMASREIAHPFEEELGFLYGVVFVGPPSAPDAHSRNVCVFAEGEVDRCPTGTSVSARLALHHARGEIDVDQRVVIESILGSRFAGRVVETTTFGPHPAVIPEVEGTAHITGRHEFLLDPDDELRDGFLLR
jgi:trans-L-3-hydroxyproline dehydratase